MGFTPSTILLFRLIPPSYFHSHFGLPHLSLPIPLLTLYLTFFSSSFYLL